MLDIARSIGPWTYHRRWFAVAPRPFDWLRFVSYRQFLGELPPRGCVRRPFWTQHIDLTLEPEALLAGMRKNTAYEVRRGQEKDALVVRHQVALETFLEFYNAFANSRSLPTLSLSQLDSMAPHLWLSQVETNEGQVLAMHAYLVDLPSSRSRLLYSATIVRSANPSDPDRALIGRANRYLHYTDFQAFQTQGLAICDLGGLAMDAATNETQGIDEFKLGFGGQTVREDHYDSWLLVMAQKILRRGI